MLIMIQLELNQVVMQMDYGLVIGLEFQIMQKDMEESNLDFSRKI